MNDIYQRIAALSPEQRARLEMRLMQQQKTQRPPTTIPRRRTAEPCMASFAQQRLWFLAQLDPDSPLYNEPKAIRINGPLEITVLQQALQALVARHEALRTTFANTDDAPMQVVATDWNVAVPVTDLQAYAADQREAELSARLAEIIHRPFDLSQDLLLRAHVFRLDTQDYVLLLITHHITSDAWSSGILYRELSHLYAAAVNGETAQLPELPIQYADYALWQRDWLQGDVLDTQLAYWKQQLAGAPALLELPTDRPRPAVQTYHGTRQFGELSPELTTALRALSRQHGVTLFMTLLAAFQTLLYRYTGQDDIVVGSPIAGRTRKETEGLIGFFVNTLVLRTRLDGNPTFLEVLGRVREMALGAYTHQDVPFEKLVEELHPARSLSYEPLFQVLFGLQNVSHFPLALPGMACTPLDISNRMAKSSITLLLREQADGLRGSLDYNTDLFDAETVTRLWGHFRTLLEGIVAQPEQAITALPVLTEAERQCVVEAWNDTTVLYPREPCVHKLFEQQVERTPEAIAVVFEEQVLTYRALNDRANQLAHELRCLGVGPETLVGLGVERSLELVVGILGILKTGGAYVPLDVAYPPQRLAFMLTDAQVTCLVTQQHLQERLPATAARVVCLETITAALQGQARLNPSVDVGADNLAYVMYTSGSTGQPKGVAMPHGALVNLINWHRHDPHLRQPARTLQFASCNFDVSFQEMLTTLSCGGSLVLISEEARRDPLLLWQVIVKAGVERLFVPYIVLQQLATVARSAGAQVRDIISAGEALQLTPEIRHLVQSLGNCRLHNHYGPTESHVVTSQLLSNHPSTWSGEAAIGHPIANTQVYVLDTCQQPVPIGIAGELYIGGAGLARGYLHRQELTAEKFVPNPFSADPAARLYRTGDLCRWRANGTLDFLGRLDAQVKLRGFRIELGEVESVLNTYPDVTQSVVTLHTTGGDDKRLVAYYVPRPGTTPNRTDLRDFLQTTLPTYMIPATFVALNALPLTANGKVDRRALPAPEWHRTASPTHVAPRTRLELQLVQLWERLLGYHPISVHDNFFEIGGHSLLAVRLLTQLERLLHRPLSLVMLFQAPTIVQLADLLQKEGWAPPRSSLLAYRPGGSKPPFFCIHGTDILTRYLDVDQPYYALHPHALDGYRPPQTVEAMAADYLQDICALQPTGPYFLGGRSIGGLVAFEMAQQLHQQGQEVALLALLDPTVPRQFARPSPSLSKKLRTIGRKILAYGCERYLHHGKRLPPRLRLAYFMESSMQAARIYVPRAYPGPIVLLPARQRSYDPEMVWGSFAAGVLEIYEVPGDHFTMFQEPHGQAVAQQLTRCLDAAQARISHTPKARQA